MNNNKPIILFDQAEKVYVRIQLSDNKLHWERSVSKDKKNWTVTDINLTLDEVVRHKSMVINNNYENLYSLILKK